MVIPWLRIEPPGGSVGTELRLPALVQPDVLLVFTLSFGGFPEAATKLLLY